MRRRLEVDPTVCDGHGLCAELAPELVELDEWGYPILADANVSDRLRQHAKRAVAACPVLALRLREISQPHSPAPSPQGIREDAGPGWPRPADLRLEAPPARSAPPRPETFGASREGFDAFAIESRLDERTIRGD
jgi:ferredoxin